MKKSRDEMNMYGFLSFSYILSFSIYMNVHNLPCKNSVPY